MKNKYLKLDNDFFALHIEQGKAYIASDNDNGLSIRIVTDETFVEYLEHLERATEISPETFQAKFSDVLERIHNETPYA